jgi:hypothetical protein
MKISTFLNRLIPVKSSSDKKSGLVVCIKGGLGNQLFQYIAGKSIAKELTIPFYCDFSSYIGYRYHHHNMLDLMGLPNNQLSPKDAKKLKETKKIDESLIKSYVDLPQLNTTEEIILLDGYWQKECYLNPRFVEEAYQALSTKYTNNKNTILASVKSKPTIAVHIRRRDYSHMGLCTEEYYIGAICALRNKYPEAQVLIFSDEPNYSEHFLRPFIKDNYQVVVTGDDILDLYIMTLCEHIIISNSTFSWWGAFFNEANKKTIICPFDWVMVDKSFKICPERWLQVKDAVKEIIPDETKAKNFFELLSKKI